MNLSTFHLILIVFFRNYTTTSIRMNTKMYEFFTVLNTIITNHHGEDKPTSKQTQDKMNEMKRIRY